MAPTQDPVNFPRLVTLGHTTTCRLMREVGILFPGLPPEDQVTVALQVLTDVRATLLHGGVAFALRQEDYA